MIVVNLNHGGVIELVSVDDHCAIFLVLIYQEYPLFSAGKFLFQALKFST